MSTETTRAVGSALRSARRRRRVSQREFAEQLGVSKSRLARLEHGDSLEAFDLVVRLLQEAGISVEVVRAQQGDEADDEPYPDVRDAAGRRFPAHADTRRMTMPHHWWFVRHPGVPRRSWPQWTWRRSSPLPWHPKSGVNQWHPGDTTSLGGLPSRDRELT